jgi:acyl-CoA reductase-like NAD-dependent aldehyde dehydrogenase
MEMAARSNAKPLLLECGGKSPHLVFEDALDLDFVADAIVQNLLWNQGQVCSAHTRLIVQQSIRERLLEKVVARARRYQPGDPLEPKTNFGPLASPAQRDRVKAYIDRGLNAGAVAVLKGKVQETGGCYVGPTIFDRVDPTMSIAQEEIFGPVLCVQAFTSEEEAITLANGTEYGLAATVWTGALGRGKRLASAIRAAGVMIRTSAAEGKPPSFLLSYEPQKASGFGAEMGLGGLKSYSTLKRVSFSGS